MNGPWVAQAHPLSLSSVDARSGRARDVLQAGHDRKRTRNLNDQRVADFDPHRGKVLGEVVGVGVRDRHAEAMPHAEAPADPKAPPRACAAGIAGLTTRRRPQSSMDGLDEIGCRLK